VGDVLLAETVRRRERKARMVVKAFMAVISALWPV
jgi:hypothetical protein